MHYIIMSTNPPFSLLALPRQNCRLLGVRGDDESESDACVLDVEFSALKAKLQKETIVVEDAADPSAKAVTLVLQARVLGERELQKTLLAEPITFASCMMHLSRFDARTRIMNAGAPRIDI